MNRFRFGLTVTACASALFLASVSALAGTKTGFPVLVDTSAMAAYGSIGSTRNTSDTLSYLACEITSENTVGTSFGFCVARNSAGVVRTCSTVNPELVAAIRSLNGDSFLEMHWNSNGDCTVIRVGNGSDMQPK